MLRLLRGAAKRARIEKDEITFGYSPDNRPFSAACLKLITDVLLSGRFLPEVHLNKPVNLAWLASRMRRGEALRLQWGDPGFDAGLISIEHNITFKGNLPSIGVSKSAAGMALSELTAKLTSNIARKTNENKTFAPCFQDEN